MSSTDSVTRSTIIRASRSRVWKALTNHEQFGAWFGVAMDAPFEAGRPANGFMTVKGFEHLRMTIDIERIEPETHFAFRWHPHAIDPAKDYSAEKKTLVVFELAETAQGTRVTVTESGFDAIPEHRRELAFRMNGEGWSIQMDQARAYVETHAD